jgi:hypothetical protein
MLSTRRGFSPKCAWQAGVSDVRQDQTDLVEFGSGGGRVYRNTPGWRLKPRFSGRGFSFHHMTVIESQTLRGLIGSLSVGLLWWRRSVPRLSPGQKRKLAGVFPLPDVHLPRHIESKRRIGRVNPLTVSRPAGRCGRAPDRRRKA